MVTRTFFNQNCFVAALKRWLFFFYIFVSWNSTFLWNGSDSMILPSPLYPHCMHTQVSKTHNAKTQKMIKLNSKHKKLGIGVLSWHDSIGSFFLPEMRKKEFVKHFIGILFADAQLLFNNLFIFQSGCSNSGKKEVVNTKICVLPNHFNCHHVSTHTRC